VTSLTFRLPGEPTPAPRPRVATIRGRGVAYYPKAYKDWRKSAADALASQYDGPLLDVPLRVSKLVFVRQRPKTTILPFPKPDLDNFQKSIFDALQGVVIKDDWLIYRIDDIEKRWTQPGEEPHIEISLETG
jgi:Holliday junction resolvase RusA-like endonuclease